MTARSGVCINEQDKTRLCGEILRVGLLPDCFPRQLTQIVQLCAADNAFFHLLDFCDSGRVKRKDPFHTNTVRDLADRERCAHARAVSSEDDPLELLDAFLVTLHNTHMHVDDISRRERGDVALHLGCVDQLQLIHSFLRCTDDYDCSNISLRRSSVFRRRCAIRHAAISS